MHLTTARSIKRRAHEKAPPIGRPKTGYKKPSKPAVRKRRNLTRVHGLKSPRVRWVSQKEA